jgi:hypothetical protein
MHKKVDKSANQTDPENSHLEKLVVNRGGKDQENVM